MKKNENVLTYFGDPLCKKYIFFIACGVQLDNGVDPPWLHFMQAHQI